MLYLPKRHTLTAPEAVTARRLLRIVVTGGRKSDSTLLSGSFEHVYEEGGDGIGHRRSAYCSYSGKHGCIFLYAVPNKRFRIGISPPYIRKPARPRCHQMPTVREPEHSKVKAKRNGESRIRNLGPPVPMKRVLLPFLWLVDQKQQLSDRHIRIIRTVPVRVVESTRLFLGCGPSRGGQDRRDQLCSQVGLI